MHSLISLFSAIDPAGKFSKENLPTQSMLELLVENIESAYYLKDRSGEFRDFHEWSILTFNDRDDVTVVHIEHATFETPLNGSINLEYVPATVEKIMLLFSGCKGTVDTNGLPRPLSAFEVPFNAFFGTFDVHGLPSKIQHIDISNNEFEGSLQLESLGHRVRMFQAETNKFCGTLNLSLLPESIENLGLAHNAFTGKIFLSPIPTRLRSVTFQDNSFETDVIIGDPAHDFTKICLSSKQHGSVKSLSGEKCKPKEVRFFVDKF